MTEVVPYQVLYLSLVIGIAFFVVRWLVGRRRPVHNVVWVLRGREKQHRVTLEDKLRKAPTLDEIHTHDISDRRDRPSWTPL